LGGQEGPKRNILLGGEPKRGEDNLGVALGGGWREGHNSDEILTKISYDNLRNGERKVERAREGGDNNIVHVRKT